MRGDKKGTVPNKNQTNADPNIIQFQFQALTKLFKNTDGTTDKFEIYIGTTRKPNVVRPLAPKGAGAV